MMKISAVTVFVGDPYLALTFYKSYKKFWHEEIDELILAISSSRDDMIEFISDLWSKEKNVTIVKVKNEHGYGSPDHGRLLDILIPKAKHDVVMTIDSDFFILKNGVIEGYKKQMGKYDIIGSTAARIDGYESLKAILHNHIKRKTGRICPWLSFWKRDILKGLNFPTLKSVFVMCENDKFVISPNPRDDERPQEKNELWLETMGWLTYELFSKRDKTSFLEIPLKSDSYFHMIGISMGVRKYMKDLKTGLIFDRNDVCGSKPCIHIPNIYYNYKKNRNDYHNEDYHASLMELINRSNTTESKMLEDKSLNNLNCIFS